MYPLLFLLFLAVAVNGQVYSTQAPCVHNNVEQLAADVVITQVLSEMDANKDGKLTLAEVFTEIFTRFDPNGDQHIDQNEFVTQWHKRFRDVTEFADYLFKHFDQDCDNKIGFSDAPALLTLFDLDHDNEVTGIEFAEYLSNLYYNCVPHFHLQLCAV